jgi:hypothetical protein
MPEVIGAAAVTALVHHYVQPAGGQHWKLFVTGQVRLHFFPQTTVRNFLDSGI